eukprot:TRINITY_DN21602_c0_g2_i1.p1 TRINITY_DN21602_c0_g2~~TRINITY_DN21602_c0_g2_i1.p1  ORF type:complete len:2082 (+),score=241.88 TRINITY_DN21602_c0_g2_i1:48-6293(+)
MGWTLFVVFISLSVATSPLLSAAPRLANMTPGNPPAVLAAIPCIKGNPTVSLLWQNVSFAISLAPQRYAWRERNATSIVIAVQVLETNANQTAELTETTQVIPLPVLGCGRPSFIPIEKNKRNKRKKSSANDSIPFALKAKALPRFTGKSPGTIPRRRPSVASFFSLAIFGWIPGTTAATPTPTLSSTPTPTATATPSETATPTPTQSLTPSTSLTASPTRSRTPSVTHSNTLSHSLTDSSSVTPTPSSTSTPSVTGSETVTPTAKWVPSWVVPPRTRIFPRASFKCQQIEIDSSESLASIANHTWTWDVVNGTAAATALLGSSRQKLFVSVPFSYLAAFSVFRLTICNVYYQCDSSTVTILLSGNIITFPQSSFYVPLTQAIDVSARTYQSTSCPDTSAEFSWSLVSASDPPAQAFVATPGPNIVILKSTLGQNATYLYRVQWSSKNDANYQIEADFSVKVNPLPIFMEIRGGNRTHPIGRSVVLDATSSYDPSPTSPPISINWTNCGLNATTRVCDKNVVVVSGLFSTNWHDFTLSSAYPPLEANNYRITATGFVGQRRSASSFIDLFIVSDSAAPSVGIRWLRSRRWQNIVNPNEKLNLISNVIAGTALTYVWKVFLGNSTTAKELVLTNSSLSTTGNSAASLVLTENALPSTVDWVLVTLVVSTNEHSGNASLLLPVATSIISGTLFAQGADTLHFDHLTSGTGIVLFALGWSDSQNGTLTYDFQAAIGNKPSFPLATIPSSKSILPISVPFVTESSNVTFTVIVRTATGAAKQASIVYPVSPAIVALSTITKRTTDLQQSSAPSVLEVAALADMLETFATQNESSPSTIQGVSTTVVSLLKNTLKVPSGAEITWALISLAKVTALNGLTAEKTQAVASFSSEVVLRSTVDERAQIPLTDTQYSVYTLSKALYSTCGTPQNFSIPEWLPQTAVTNNLLRSLRQAADNVVAAFLRTVAVGETSCLVPQSRDTAVQICVQRFQAAEVQTVSAGGVTLDLPAGWASAVGLNISTSVDLVVIQFLPSPYCTAGIDLSPVTSISLWSEYQAVDFSEVTLSQPLRVTLPTTELLDRNKTLRCYAWNDTTGWVTTGIKTQNISQSTNLSSVQVNVTSLADFLLTYFPSSAISNPNPSAKSVSSRTFCIWCVLASIWAVFVVALALAICMDYSRVRLGDKDKGPTINQGITSRWQFTNFIHALCREHVLIAVFNRHPRWQTTERVILLWSCFFGATMLAAAACRMDRGGAGSGFFSGILLCFALWVLGWLFEHTAIDYKKNEVARHAYSLALREPMAITEPQDGSSTPEAQRPTSAWTSVPLAKQKSALDEEEDTDSEDETVTQALQPNRNNTPARRARVIDGQGPSTPTPARATSSLGDAGIRRSSLRRPKTVDSPPVIVPESRPVTIDSMAPVTRPTTSAIDSEFPREFTAEQLVATARQEMQANPVAAVHLLMCAANCGLPAGKRVATVQDGMHRCAELLEMTREQFDVVFERFEMSQPRWQHATVLVQNKQFRQACRDFKQQLLLLSPQMSLVVLHANDMAPWVQFYASIFNISGPQLNRFLEDAANNRTGESTDIAPKPQPMTEQSRKTSPSEVAIKVVPLTWKDGIKEVKERRNYVKAAYIFMLVKNADRSLTTAKKDLEFGKQWAAYYAVSGNSPEADFPAEFARQMTMPQYTSFLQEPLFVSLLSEEGSKLLAKPSVRALRSAPTTLMGTIRSNAEIGGDFASSDELDTKDVLPKERAKPNKEKEKEPVPEPTPAQQIKRPPSHEGGETSQPPASHTSVLTDMIVLPSAVKPEPPTPEAIPTPPAKKPTRSSSFFRTPTALSIAPGMPALASKRSFYSHLVFVKALKEGEKSQVGEGTIDVPYSNIDIALARIKANTALVLLKGVYTNVIIRNPPRGLRLKGADPDSVMVRSAKASGSALILIGAKDCTVTGLRLEGRLGIEAHDCENLTVKENVFVVGSEPFIELGGDQTYDPRSNNTVKITSLIQRLRALSVPPSASYVGYGINVLWMIICTIVVVGMHRQHIYAKEAFYREWGRTAGYCLLVEWVLAESVRSIIAIMLTHLVPPRSQKEKEEAE